MAEKLDFLDKDLLNEIQGSVCQPKINTLAKKLGKPTTTIYQRLKKLEQKGLITGYRGSIDCNKVGKPLTVWMLIALGSKRDFEEVGKALMKMPGVVEVHYVSGIYDFLIKAKMLDTEEYYHFSTKHIQQLQGVIRTEGFISTKIFKEGAPLFI